jgi:Putative peptidoglycan binding domain
MCIYVLLLRAGTCVTSLQNLLASKGFSPGTVDGSFGPNTETAVRNFQSNRRLTVRHHTLLIAACQLATAQRDAKLPDIHMRSRCIGGMAVPTHRTPGSCRQALGACFAQPLQCNRSDLWCW